VNKENNRLSASAVIFFCPYNQPVLPDSITSSLLFALFLTVQALLKNVD